MVWALLHNQSIEPMPLNTANVILPIRLITHQLFYRMVVLFEHLLASAVSPGTIKTGVPMAHDFRDDERC